MITLFLETHFDSAHYLPGHETCGAMHGHTYPLEIEVTGPVEDGVIVDLAILRKIVAAALPDHRVLNEIAPVPTVENLVAWLAGRLSADLEKHDLKLVSLKLYEGLRKGAIWRS